METLHHSPGPRRANLTVRQVESRSMETTEKAKAGG
jgi:hypothetical protein